MHANYRPGMYLVLVHSGEQNIYDSHPPEFKVWGLETDINTKVKKKKNRNNQAYNYNYSINIY